MSEEVDVNIREALAEDAEQIVKVSQTIGKQTEFLVMDEHGMDLPIHLLENQLETIYESDKQLLLVAEVDGQIVGTASVRTSEEKRISHIGEVGISILQDYWGIGLGSVLLEELIDWSQQIGQIRRLELTVQKQNSRASHLYEKYGFQTEAVLERGAIGDDGRFLDVLLMSKMIDPVG
ncbi:GNAT family N-acetyltransferase [Tetragenococcus halophilus]|uniref:Acetyltransferase n=1 Tax=Tetragenococcus halophilus (strain DSM 20338 / JCM 20259 / NCIMB 9735 / NBRC 12172) TaxID=945021 RepID=A0AAN1SGB2_TETHN|nr:GNAT family N-acetyltransferase [Tetragenococcus halophilus]BAK94465.1 putative acetyltransferase [Tetragenococcus halophilus NBRC 12172]GBD70144.1 putative acetyltransferase [Tetragenococcus halophilus subsp. halophilus]